MSVLMVTTSTFAAAAAAAAAAVTSVATTGELHCQPSSSSSQVPSGDCSTSAGGCEGYIGWSRFMCGLLSRVVEAGQGGLYHP